MILNCILLIVSIILIILLSRNEEYYSNYSTMNTDPNTILNRVNCYVNGNRKFILEGGKYAKNDKLAGSTSGCVMRGGPVTW